MDILWRLVCAHLIADFSLQTNKLAVWKSKSIFGLIVHSSIFFVVSIIFTLPYFKSIRFTLVLLWIAHFAIDYGRTKIISNNPSWDNIYFYICDQVSHYLSIFIAYKIQFAKMSTMPAPAWVFVISVLIIATHFTTITIYYAERQVYKESIIEWKEKYFSILERIIILSCFLLPGGWWMIFPVVILIRWYIYKKAIIKINFQAINVILGVISAVIAGVFFRMFFMPL
ncbi:MAG: DUF3307 domain-containing protein [Elusimicrobiota bacterium]